MKVVIDSCVLYPTVLREIVLGVTAQGAFRPIWSARILEEWRRAAARNGQGDGRIAEAEIRAVRALFPEAEVSVSPDTEAVLSLPDPDDVHVLAAAVDGDAEELMTLNLGDFPSRTLARAGVLRRAPDEFLLEQYHADPEAMREIVDEVMARAAAHGIDTGDPRRLLKRARLPRLAKALYAS